MKHKIKTNVLFLQQVSWVALPARGRGIDGTKREDNKKERVNIKFYIISADNTDYPQK